MRWKGRESCKDIGDAFMRAFPQVFPVRGLQKEEVIVQDPQEVVVKKREGLT